LRRQAETHRQREDCETHGCLRSLPSSLITPTKRRRGCRLPMVEPLASSVRPGPLLHSPVMNNLAYWTKRLKEAERELDAATRLADLNAAAKKLMRAKEALKRLEQQTAVA
jgi:hypothetical protein